MGTLYECLKEARLEKYYSTFRANGISRSDSLAKLTVEECSAMGVTSIDDKRRLIELINIVRSVHGSGRPSQFQSNREQRVGTPSRSFRSSTRLEQTPSRTSESVREVSQSVGRGLEITRDVTVRDRTPNYSATSYTDLLELLTETSSEESSDDSLSDDEPPIKQPARAADKSKYARNTTERVRHNSGYNYGVPKSRIIKRHKSSASRGSGEERIRVCVRKRPVTRKEVKAVDEDIVVVESTTTLTVNEPKLAVDLKPYLLQHEFVFDEVFDEKCSNEDVYVRATRPLINCLFNGGSATCFAYGQTGAGKTHTMMGNKDTPGLYLLAANDIFSLLQSGKYGHGLHVWVSFFEIYCGQLFDLLNKRNRLHPREDGSHRVCIAGLTETEAVDSKVLVEVLEYGNSVRSKGATGVNPDSSRSHAILQMEIRDDADHKYGRISFIDLAGSERAADVTDTDKQTRLEGAEINQSLLALKECIRSIDQDLRHTPFRQSKLTHILKDSFVGNSRTCMIANISPTQAACENTLNTLRYADRVKELRRDSKNTNISQTMNLLMNIPITTPTVFNPSNVLASSTPMKSQKIRHSSHRHSEFQLDPSETPIRGHNVPKKSVKIQSAKHKSTSPTRSSSNRNFTVASKLADIPRKMKEATASRNSTVLRQPLAEASASYSVAVNVQSGASASHGTDVITGVNTEASASESDHTDTDSNNLTVPKSGDGIIGNMQVVRSSDTENDFPTSDFNNVENLNDLNKNGGKHTSSPAAQAWGPAEDQETKSAYFTNPEPIMFQTIASHVDEQIVGTRPVQKTSKYELPHKRETCEVFGPGYFSQQDQVRPKSSVMANPIHSKLNPKPHATRPGIPPALKESFEDELLFDHPSPGNKNLQQSVIPTNQTADNQEPMGFPQPYIWGSSSEDQNIVGAEIQTHKNGTLNQLSNIPPVLPAHSSDLTIFSQRLPLKTKTKTQTKPHVVDSASPKSRSQSPKSRTPPLSPKSRPKSPKLRMKKADSLPPTSPVPKSPTHSDDSLEGVRASHSDQGQGPYRISRSTSLRKEKSDPMLALHLQNKKQTVPEPAEFLKYLSRSGASRSNPSPTPISTGHGSPKQKYSEDQLYTELNLKESDSVRTQSDESLSSSSRFGTASSHVSRYSKQTDQHHSNSIVAKQILQETNTRSHSPIIVKEMLNNNISIDSQTELLKPDSSMSCLKINSTSSNNVPVTDTSSVVSMFSPIHPQPLTTKAVSQSVTTITVSQDVLQPKPMSSRPWKSVNLSQVTADSTDLRNKLISAHEDQLTRVTSICKQEMKLLLTVKKAGPGNFENYLKKLQDLLNQKMATVQYLQENIKQYFVEGQNTISDI